MQTLAQILGQQRAISQLQRALATQRVAHAYLFAGPAKCGKHSTGLAFAAALNCISQPGVGCGECEACNKIAANNHPDVVTLPREGAAQIIPIKTIRERVIPTLATAPHEGRARVFLVEEALSLAGPSANALLKTLEEPPARTHFILGTVAPDQVLQTIRSRCQRVNFVVLPAEIRAELDATNNSDEDNERAARLTGLAKDLASAAEVEDLGVLFATAAAVGSDRGDTVDVLGLLAGHYHRRAVLAASDHQLQRATALSSRASAVLKAETAVARHNAHGQLALERLLTRLRALPRLR